MPQETTTTASNNSTADTDDTMVRDSRLKRYKNVHKKKAPDSKKKKSDVHHHHSLFGPSRSMPHELWKDAIGSDQDVWIERSCLGRIKQPKKKKSSRERRIVYYYSLQTGQTKLLEPPTGASFILLESEVEHYLSQSAQEQVAEKIQNAVPTSLSGLRRPKPSLDVTKKGKQQCFLFRRRMKQQQHAS